MSTASLCTCDQILIRCLLTELLAGVRPGAENVVWERIGGRGENG